MAKYVAFIRAINVPGHAIIKMQAVKAVFAAAGGANVATYIQSGNVLFDAPARAAQGLVADVRLRLRRALGEEPTVVVRTLRDLGGIVSGRPFGAHTDDPALKLYVAFLARKPRSAELPMPVASAPERLTLIGIDGREAFVVSARKRNGFYGFPNNFIESELGVRATCRNWSTVRKLALLDGA
jgi:uncharacterized protein (DUF1697 family)